MRKSIWYRPRITSLLWILALDFVPPVSGAPLYSVVDLGPSGISLGPINPYPTIPASLASAPRFTTDAGALTTIPVYAQSGSSDPRVDLTPIAWYAQYISPSGNALHIGLSTPGFEDGDSSASAINDLGQAIGQSFGASGISHAFLFADGKTYDLNDAILPQPKWTITHAWNIDDQGRILASATNESGAQRTVELVPQAVPEPSALIAGLFFVGATTLHLIRRRRFISPGP